jgi:hypothetical protein
MPYALRQSYSATGSMPWNCQKHKLLTDKWLEVGITGKTGQIGDL